MGVSRREPFLAVVGAAAIVLGVLAPRLTSAQSITHTSSDAVEQNRAAINSGRARIVEEIVARWRPTMEALDYTKGWDRELSRALQTATAEKLIAASAAESYGDVIKALYGRWPAADVIPLAPGHDLSRIIGSPNEDVVFTPLTPCRIVDTRMATGPLAGRIGPNAGKQFQVNLADYSTQGGFAGSCGLSTLFEVSAVAINVTSTDQTGSGNVRVTESGAGIPNVSLLNYQQGVNIANAAVVRSALAAGSDIFVYSGNSASHVVVDVMGYFAAPMSTPLDIIVHQSTFGCPSGFTCTIQLAPCVGFHRLTGGGMSVEPAFPDVFWLTSGPRAIDANQWECVIRNTNPNDVSHTCTAFCSKLPGR